MVVYAKAGYRAIFQTDQFETNFSKLSTHFYFQEEDAGEENVIGLLLLVKLLHFINTAIMTVTYVLVQSR